MINDKDKSYIDHEVRLRVMKEVNDDRFIQIEKSKRLDRLSLQESILTMEKVYDLQFTELRKAIKKTDSKLTFIITTLLTIVAIPLFLKFFH